MSHVAVAAEVWIEIVAPVDRARQVLARALQDLPAPPGGVAVAVSELGTLLLNPRAWSVFHGPLKALDGLQTRHSSRIPMPALVSYLVLS